MKTGHPSLHRLLSITIAILLLAGTLNVSLAAAAPVPAVPTGSWKEYHDPVNNYTLAVPASWTIYPTPAGSLGGTAVLMNYNASNLRGNEAWPNGAFKLELQVFDASPNQELTSWFSQYLDGLAQAQGSPLVLLSSSEQILPAGKATHFVVSESNGSQWSRLLLAMPGDRILSINITPEAHWQHPDVLALLNSLDLQPGSTFTPPSQPPQPAANFASLDIEPLVIHPCDWGSEVGGSPISLQMPFSTGTTWIVGGGGYFYGDGTHSNANNDYYATDWNMSTDDYGQPVFPVAGGTAYIVYGTTGYGNYVDVVHDGGQVRTRYGHLSAISVVNGAPVSTSTEIGKVGSTGNSTGNHLHMSFRFLVNNAWNSQYGQGRRPSPMQTSAGSWDLCDGQSRTVASKSGGGGTNNPPAGYTKCADENGRCAFSGTADVVYGALNSFTSPRSFSDGVDCNNSVFGDPISGTGKSCYYKSTGGGSSDSWSSSFYDTIDRWNDNNNAGNYRCSETISSTFLDQNYGTGTRCGMDPDSWVGEYSGSRNFGAGNYVFYVEHDDGLKLWINGSNKADRSGSGSTYVCPAIYLNGSTPLKVMLREDGGDARVKVSWSTDTSPCNAPGSFGKSGPGNGAGSVSTSPTLSWNSSSGASEYKYCIDTTNNANCDSGWQSTGSSTSVALGGLSSATTYYWQVLSTNSRIETVADGGTWWSFSTQPVYAAQFVSQSVPTSMLTGRTYSVSVTFRNNGSETWTAASYYNLGSQNPTDNSTWGTSRAILPASAAIAPGQTATYSFNVVAPASAGSYNFQWRMVRDYITWFGDSSTNQTVTVSAAPSVPATPGGLTASDGTDYATIQLSWNAASGASYYEIFRNSANSLPASAHKTGLTGLSINDTLLLDNVTYYYWVRACNANGCSPISAAESGFLKINIGDDIALPLTPILVQATSLSINTLSATQGIFDPVLTSCNRGSGYATIWLRVSTPTARWLVVDTIGSDYDTMLAVWSGTPGNLQPVGTCNDDIGAGSYQSRVAVPLAAGGSYYVEVSQFQSAPGAPSDVLSKPAVFAASGGALRLNIRWASSLLVKSAGAYDGFVIESSETSSQGGSLDSTSAVFKLGDTATRRQIRAILAFNTAALPDNAVILGAALKIRQASLPLGSNPFGVLGPIMVDARTGPFGLLGLNLTDFQAAATLNKVASFAVRPSLVGQWYAAPLLPAGLPIINKTGWSEFRLAYRLDDNNDLLNNQLSFNSGSTPDLAPQLVISYYVP